MKLEALFTVKNGKLCSAKDGSQINPAAFEKIEISWAKIQLDDELYNEEFLAALREQLKALDGQEKFAILVPLVDKDFDTVAQKEDFIKAMNHAARRVKDCVSVAGFALPAKILADGLSAGATAPSFMKALAAKHAHYVYFAKEADCKAFALAENLPNYPIATL